MTNVSNRVKKQEREARLTVKTIREALARGAKGADELHEQLERAHLRGLSRSMSLRLD